MPNTLTDQAYREILTKIIKLEYEPGRKISEKNIEKDLGIGRTPVREAILRVKHSGLITVKPQSGTYISLIKLNRVNDALFSRRSLEIAILKEASQCDVSAEAKQQLLDLHQKLQKAANKKDVSLFFKYFDQLHESYYLISNHKMIWAWIQNINIYFYRIIVLILEANQVSWHQIADDEKEILDAVLNKDKDKIAFLLNKEMAVSPTREQGLVTSFPEYFA